MPDLIGHLIAVCAGAQTTTVAKGTIHLSRSFRVRDSPENRENHDAKGITLLPHSFRVQDNAASTSVRASLWSRLSLAPYAGRLGVHSKMGRRSGAHARRDCGMLLMLRGRGGCVYWGSAPNPAAPACYRTGSRNGLR